MLAKFFTSCSFTSLASFPVMLPPCITCSFSLGSCLVFGTWQDEDAFFKDYAESHKKLSELGFVPSSSGSKPVVKDIAVLAQSAVGVAVAAAVVALTYLYEVRKKMK